MSTATVSIVRINRVTAAIAGLPQTFNYRDVLRASAVQGGSVHPYLNAMAAAGWITVRGRLPGGAKIWRKTAQYRPPTQDALNRKQASAVARDAAQASRTAKIDALGQLLRGWTATHWPPCGYSAGDMA